MEHRRVVFIDKQLTSRTNWLLVRELLNRFDHELELQLARGASQLLFCHVFERVD